MIEIQNKTIWQMVVAESVASVGGSELSMNSKSRWTNAIAKATAKLEGNQSYFVEYDGEKDEMFIWSQNSNEVYTVNGKCQCFAELQNVPCYHKAMKQLWKNYLLKLKDFENKILSSEIIDDDSCIKCKINLSEEDSDKCDKCNQDDALYLKETNEKPTTKIGNIRI